MTTIDSDSESQDSDDGRRFRFEATRKDDTLRLQSQNRRRSPLSKGSNYRSRSTDRGSHNRRNNDKTKQDRDRKEGSDRDKRKISKERDSRDNKHDNKSNSKDSRHTSKGNVKDVKDVKEVHESRTLVDNEKRSGDSKNSNHRECKDSARNLSNSKDHKNSKDSRSRESKNSSTRALKDTKIREAKDPRDQDVKSSKDREAKNSRDSEIKERGPKRSRDASHERLTAAKHGHRSHEKYKSRDRSDNREKSKQSDGEKSKEERNKNLTPKKKSRKQSERKIIKRDAHSPSKILEQIGSDSESDLGALDPDVGPVMSLDTYEDCREMNLSDFDIISDTEGSSSDTLDPKTPPTGPIIKGEILPPHYYGPKITKRVSRRQYERLVRRQAALNTRRLEELYKVNPRNNDVTPLAPSNNNPSAVSDFLLGPEASVSTVGERRRSQKREAEETYNEDDSEDRELEDKFKSEENYDQDSSKLYNLQIDKLSLSNPNENDKSSGLRNKSSTVKKDGEEFVDRKIYGPSLPPKCRKDYSLHPDAESGVETIVNTRNVAREVVSSSRKDRRSRSLEKMSPVLLKRRVSTETKTRSRHENSDNILTADSSLQVISKKDTNESRNAVIGPSLPPAIRLNSESPEAGSAEPKNIRGSSLSNQVADLEPEEKSVPIIGPSLPPHLKLENHNSSKSKHQDSTSPQRTIVSSNNSIFGPTLPPYLISKVTQNTEDKSDSDSEEGAFGPLPPDHPAATDDYIQQQLEERAKRMKNKLDSKNLLVEKREEWMLELPSARAANLGLGKRQFRSKAGPDMSDRSSWTDTPVDKARKKEDKLLGKTKVADPAKESERLAIQQRDKAMEKMAEKHASKKRKESLLEIHKKKLRKKKKKEEKEAKEAGKPTRRPFDRDIDLQANRFDEAQKKSILNKAQLLNDRFSRGESKYL